jgi:hypothetical protein
MLRVIGDLLVQDTPLVNQGQQQVLDGGTSRHYLGGEED